MPIRLTIGDYLRSQGISRREFLKFCATTASLLALPPAMIPSLADTLTKRPRPSVIWLSFQECTGCTESLTRSQIPTLEELLFKLLSLDYHHTLLAVSGGAAERALYAAMTANDGNYLLVIDGSIPLGNPGYSTIAGVSNKELLLEVANGAKAVIAVGTCASYGGLPHAFPNPTGAVPVQELIRDKPLLNVPGCPPMPTLLANVITNYVIFQQLPQLDALKRPLPWFGRTIHDRCYRRHFFHHRRFAKSFDDNGAKRGWCLHRLGCKGPTTHNACPTLQWNGGVSYPIAAGHGCLGCAEPNFWDAGSFYTAQPVQDHHHQCQHH